MSAERNALRSIEPEANARIDPGKHFAVQAAALSAALGLTVGIIVELAIPGQGPRIGLAIVGLVGSGFVSSWAVRVMISR